MGTAYRKREDAGWELYRAIGAEITRDAIRADRLLPAYHGTAHEDDARRSSLLPELLQNFPHYPLFFGMAAMKASAS